MTHHQPFIVHIYASERKQSAQEKRKEEIEVYFKTGFRWLVRLVPVELPALPNLDPNSTFQLIQHDYTVDLQ